LQFIIKLFNFSRKDERYHETYNKFSNGYSSSRNYESNTTASIAHLPNATIANPRQDLSFLSSTALPSFNPEIFRLPPEIQQIIHNNSVVNVKIREYDLTVCKDPLSSSISFSIPTINSVQALPAPSFNSNIENFKVPQNVMPNSDSEISSKNVDEQDSETSQEIQSDISSREQNTSNNSSFEPSQPKKLRENSITDYDIDDIKVTDISTAGSSLSTEDDDFYFSGGAARVKLRRLNHRLKKLEMRREERREKLKLTRKENETAKELEIIEIDDSSGSTPDEDDFLNMVGEAIKKHNDTILKERKSAERKRILKTRKS
jgi:hypothetical protein